MSPNMMTKILLEQFGERSLGSIQVYWSTYLKDIESIKQVRMYVNIVSNVVCKLLSIHYCHEQDNHAMLAQCFDSVSGHSRAFFLE